MLWLKFNWLILETKRIALTAAYKLFMLMTVIRDYIKLQGRVDLHNISNHFCLPESAITQMLSFWVKKGVIRIIPFESQSTCQTKLCASCMSCNVTKQSAIYTWV